MDTNYNGITCVSSSFSEKFKRYVMTISQHMPKIFASLLTEANNINTKRDIYEYCLKKGGTPNLASGTPNLASGNPNLASGNPK